MRDAGRELLPRLPYRESLWRQLHRSRQDMSPATWLRLQRVRIWERVPALLRWPVDYFRRPGAKFWAFAVALFLLELPFLLSVIVFIAVYEWFAAGREK